MKTKKIYYLFLVIAIGFAQMACSPEDGRDGIDGEQGPAGEDGTANVLYSNWMPISWNIQDTPTYKVMSIEEPLITQEFIDSGGVAFIFYRYTASYTAVFPLPVILGNNYMWYYSFTDPNFSGFLLIVDSVDGITPVNAGFVNPGNDIRYILITEGIPLGKNAQQDWGNVDKNNYEEVAAFLGIQD